MGNTQEKIKFQTPVEAPGKLDPTDRSYHDEFPSYSDLYVAEENAWYVAPGDARLAEIIESAYEAISAGDTATARARAKQVLEEDPRNFFARTVLIEASDLAGSTMEEKMSARLAAIAELNRQMAGLDPGPATITVPDIRALWFEMARHYYNLGDDLWDIAWADHDMEKARQAAKFFSLSRVALPNLQSEAMDKSCRQVRILREAVAHQFSGNDQEARKLLQLSRELGPYYAQPFLERTEQYRPLLEMLRNLTDEEEIK